MRAEAPEVECDHTAATLDVSDVVDAATYYVETLGFRHGFTWGEPPTFAGVTLGGVQLFFRKGSERSHGCAVNFVVGNADELFEFQRAQGVHVLQPPGDREYGLRDYRVRDRYGHELGFGQHLYNMGP